MLIIKHFVVQRQLRCWSVSVVPLLAHLVADLLRGDYKPSEYRKVILPFTILRRLDCVLAPTKAKVLAELEARRKAGINPEPFLLKIAKLNFETRPSGTPAS